MSDNLKLAAGTNSGADRARTVASRVLTFGRSNSSVLGAFLVIGLLFLGQRYAGAWLTDSAVIDESDIVPATSVVPTSTDGDGEAASCDPWLLTFSDDFEGEQVDDERWIVYNSPGHDGNGLRRPEAITIEEGILVITGQKVDGEIVSGGMASRHQQMYGRFEARVRTEADPSETMSGVLITWPAGNYYPDGGENDFYETLSNASRDPFYSFIHYPDTSHEEIVHDASAEDWHEMVMEWTPEAITVYRDGELAGTVTEPEAIPDYPHVLTAQLDAKRDEMGDNVVRMYVDWVRVYQRNESLPSDC